MGGGAIRIEGADEEVGVMKDEEDVLLQCNGSIIIIIFMMYFFLH